MNLQFVGTWMLGLLAIVSGPDGSDIRQDRELLQGAWLLVAIEVNGQRVDDSNAQRRREEKDIVIVVQRDEFFVRHGERLYKGGTFKLDPSKRPRAIDITVEHVLSSTFACIYDVQRDVLKVCQPIHPENRPTEFAGKADGKHMLYVLRRMQ